MPPSALYPEGSIAGQVALVTGASSGIGEATAWRLAELGVNLILVARRADRLEKLEKDIQEKYKVQVFSVTIDISNLQALGSLADELPAALREVDILVNNAGLALGKNPVHENIEQDIINMVNTNVTAVALLTKNFAPGMVARNRGHIINISSIAAHQTYPGGSIYCGTKSFIEAFTTAARHDLVGTDVRVTSISPGAVRTEFSIIRFKGDEAQADAVYDGMVPLSAADCADAVIYAVTRPAHVQIGEIILYATNQSSPQSIARVLKKKTSLEQLADQLTARK